MPAPLSNDLRQRILLLYRTELYTQDEIAQRMMVSRKTVSEIWIRYCKTGSVDPKPASGGQASKLEDIHLRMIQFWIGMESDLTLVEISKKLFDEFDIKVSKSTVDRALSNMDYTRKKKVKYDPRKNTNKNQEKRIEYQNDIKNIKPEDLVFIDETGMGDNMSSNYGRAPEGERIKEACPRYSSVKLTAIAAVSLSGIFAEDIFKGSMDYVAFNYYLKEILSPSLRTGQVVVMDNLSSHKKAKEGLKAIEEAGARYIFLPPYSPELSPIEFVWSKVKSYMRKAKERFIGLVGKTFNDALNTVTEDDLFGWFEECLAQ